MKLKPQEERLLRFIVNYKKAHDGNSPGHREMCEGLSLVSTSVSNYWIDKLIAKSILEKIDHKIHVVGGIWIPPRSYTDEFETGSDP